MPELNYTILKNSTNLKAYYRFESGAETTDSSGNSHTLTAIATPTFSAGKFGQGVNYASASSQAHSATQGADFQPTAILSAGMWFKSSTAAIQGMFQSYSEAASKVSGWDIHLLADGSFECLLGNNTGITLNTHYTKVVSGTGYADGNWHHVVLVWNKPTAQLYIDGKYIASSGSFNNDLVYSAQTVVRVGCRNTDGSTNLQFFNGSLDDVFLLNGTALSADQIKELYEGRYIGEGMPETSLVGGYHLSDITDYSGNNYHLTNNNTVTFPAGKFNKCADGGTTNTNKSLSIASALGLSNSSNRTISIWVKMNTELSGADSFGAFISISHADVDVNYRIGYWRESSVNRVTFDRGKFAVGTTAVKYAINLGTTSWHNLVLTWDGTNIIGYLNGVSIGTLTFSGNGSNGFSDELRILCDSGGANFISSLIDEVRIYNVAKDANWVRKQYAWAKGMFL